MTTEIELNFPSLEKEQLQIFLQRLIKLLSFSFFPLVTNWGYIHLCKHICFIYSMPSLCFLFPLKSSRRPVISRSLGAARALGRGKAQKISTEGEPVDLMLNLSGAQTVPG